MILNEFILNLKHNLMIEVEDAPLYSSSQTLEMLSHVKKCVTLNPKFVTFDTYGIHINQHISRLANLMSGQLHHAIILIIHWHKTQTVVFRSSGCPKRTWRLSSRFPFALLEY